MTERMMFNLLCELEEIVDQLDSTLTLLEAEVRSFQRRAA